MPLTLPTNANVPPDTLSSYSILIAGPKKIGKTSLAAAAGKRPFIIQGEPGNSKAIPVRQVDITSWLDFIEVMSLLEKTPNYCDVKILDDVPSFYNMCFAYQCKKNGFEHPQDLGYGKGWKFIEYDLDKHFKKFVSLQGGTIFTAHTAVKEYENRHGKKFDRLETTMTGQADKLLDAIVQIWGVIEWDKDDQRVFTIRGNDFVKAGQGIRGRFLYPDGTEIQSIPLGNSPEEGWANIEKGFRNELEKPTTRTQVSIPVKPTVNKLKLGGK